MRQISKGDFYEIRAFPKYLKYGFILKVRIASDPRSKKTQTLNMNMST